MGGVFAASPLYIKTIWKMRLVYKFNIGQNEEISTLCKISNNLYNQALYIFREMLSKNSSKVSVIVTFLVMLELIKTGFVEVHQESTFGDIDINVVKDPELIDEIIVEE